MSSESSSGTHYALLGVPRQASAEEIGRAYRRLAKTVHPDKGGDAEAFKELAHAYEVLVDPEQRGLYDKKCVKEEAAKRAQRRSEPSHGGGFSGDPFMGAGFTLRGGGFCFGEEPWRASESTCGGGFRVNEKDPWWSGGSRPAGAAANNNGFQNAPRDEYLTALLHQRRPPAGLRSAAPFAKSFQDEPGNVNNRVVWRGPDTTCPLYVSPHELRSGAVVKRIPLHRKALCSNCNGEGIKARPAARCASCYGEGVREVFHEREGVMRPVNMLCHCCEGTGIYFNPDEWDRCAACSGLRVLPEHRMLEVVVGVHMRSGDRITFPGLGDDAPGSIAGDFVLVLVIEQ